MDKKSKAVPARDLPAQVKCPTCGKMTVYQGNPHRPFCSPRCLTMDQAAWAEEKYALPTQDMPGMDEEG